MKILPINDKIRISKIVMLTFLIFLPRIIFSQQMSLSQDYTIPGTQRNLGPEAGQEEEMVEAQVERLQLAISNELYPVTPGDIYRITFTTAGNLVTNQIIVESDYSINLGIFGEIAIAGMNFPQLKKRVERLIQEAYPRSLPSLTMISTGTFEVPVVGEIPQTRYVTAWGLSRLNDVITGNLGRHSSIRDVTVISRNGERNRYDLWMARYRGELSQNPLIRPGDRVEVSRVKKEIQISGEVYRPGTYQLVEGESLQEIEFFSGGFTPLADLRRVTVERFSGIEADLIVFDYNEYNGEFDFEDRDIITIPSKRDQDLQVTVVGAVFNPGRYQYSPPENYMYYVNLAGGIDFERNSGNEVTIVDRFGNRQDADYPIRPGDTITVLNNNFIYNFNRHFPVVTTGFAFILTIIQIVNLANQ
ncbi:SLBB domain-containing protein [Marispirochaeta aestuarii]|uniref:SLBB domain-containing protein n=1 Tax=Marispirochaeta aestuarii TaxID=1963862 RepID=UPI002ABDDE4F|nr:SLBB domain-containing protein [Marispirochaeta aestuarii]